MANIVASGQITLVDLNDAKSLSAYLQSNQPKIQIRNGDSGALTPDWSSSNVVLTPELYVSGTATNIIAQAKSITWYEAGNPTPIAAGNGYAIGASNPKALTISANKMSAGTPQKTYIAEIVWTDTDTGQDIPIKAEIEFAQVASGVKGNAGANAISAILSNDADVIPTDAAGNNGNFTGANTTMTIYEGATDVTASWAVTAGTPVGLTGSLSGKTYTVTAMSADTAYVDLIATRSGYATITRRFALAKSKTGVAGTTPTLYRLIPSVNAIAKNISGVYNPTTLTVTGKSQTGSGTYGDYAGRFIIAESTDGTTFVDKYTSAANEISKVWTPTAGIKSLRVRIYLAGGTTTMLDEQIIPVVSDGATGADAVVAYAWNPNGNVIKNGSGSLTAQADLYKGGVKQTSGITYLWYKLIGGTWTALTSAFTGYNTATLTIPASEISGTTSYKVRMTYGGQNYEDVVTVVDQTDPIQAVPIAAEGTVYKNGVGTKNVTGKLYQSGVEIDAAGTVYDYKWFMRDESGALDPNFGGTGINSMTGKTITIPAAKVTNIGNLVLEVWTK